MLKSSIATRPVVFVTCKASLIEAPRCATTTAAASSSSPPTTRIEPSASFYRRRCSGLLGVMSSRNLVVGAAASNVSLWGNTAVRHFINKPTAQPQQANNSSTNTATEGGGHHTNSSGVPLHDPFSKDLYKRLGLTKKASESDIKHAFQGLAKRYHPDQNRDNQAEAQEQFVHLKEAKDILGNETKRKIYDETGSQKEAEDPKMYRTKKAVRQWVPLLLLGVVGVAFAINSTILKPAKNSSNLYVRYFFNYVSIILMLFILPNKFIAGAFLTWSHSRYYKQDMMADVSDHVIFCVQKPQGGTGRFSGTVANSTMKGSKAVVPIEVVPEDLEVRAGMEGMQLQVVSRDGQTLHDFDALATVELVTPGAKKGDPESKEMIVGKFIVKVPVADFLPAEDEPLDTKGQRYVRVVCRSGGGLDLFDKRIPLPV